MGKTQKKVNIVSINMRFPEPMLEAIDLAVEIGQASNRSDFIRHAVATALKELTVTTEMKKRKLQ